MIRGIGTTFVGFAELSGLVHPGRQQEDHALLPSLEPVVVNFKVI